MTTARRFLLILLINALAILVPAGLFMQRVWTDIETAQTEAQGVTPARALLAATKLLQQHRGLSAVLLGGKEDAAAARSAKAGEVERALAAYGAALRSAGGARPN